MKSYQVVGIGNAIVDVFSPADDSFLDLMGIEKGIMQLVERERGELLYGAMNDRQQAPGGSVANTLAGLGNLGLTTAFIGRVHDDALGRFYAQYHGRGRHRFRQPAGAGGRTADLALDDLRLARWRAVDEHLPRHFVRARPRRRVRQRGRQRRDPVPRRLSLRQAQGQTGLRARRRPLPRRRAARPGSRSPTRSASTATATTSAVWCKILDYVIGNEHEWDSLYQTDLSAALEQAAAGCGPGRLHPVGP